MDLYSIIPKAGSFIVYYPFLLMHILILLFAYLDPCARDLGYCSGNGGVVNSPGFARRGAADHFAHLYFSPRRYRGRGRHAGVPVKGNPDPVDGSIPSGRCACDILGKA